jgi:hypothetical protein
MGLVCTSEKLSIIHSPGDWRGFTRFLKDLIHGGFNFLAYERTYSQNIDDEPILVGYTNEDTNDDDIHRNYKSEILDFSAEFILNIGNVLFHSPYNKWNLYGVFGLGVNLPKTYVDLLHDGQLYDFSGVTEGLDLTTSEGRKEARNNLKDLVGWRF